MAELVQPYAVAGRHDLRRQVHKSSTFLFLTERPVLSDCFVQAIEAEFPQVSAVQVSDLHAACSGIYKPVSLIFIDLSMFDRLAAWAPLLSQAHPASLLALLQSDARRSAPVAEILRSDLVCGVLPMHLKLDIWLAVIRLLLIGGEYIPPAMLRTLSADKVDGMARPAAAAPTPPPQTHDPRELGALTEREMQILELVARGLQNKVIAAALQLSEHTVKIHLHNIITKLGTSNRTQAAAVFHRSRGQEVDGTVPVPSRTQDSAFMHFPNR